MKGLAASDDWMALEFGDEPYFRKPPLLFWIGAAAFRIFGATAAVARLVGTLPSLALLAGIYLLARRLYGRERAFLAALSVATTYVFVRNGGNPRMDTALTLAILLSVATIVAGERRPGILWLFWIPVGAGMLLKGPAGLLPLLIVAAWSAIRRSPHPWSRWPFWAGLPLAPLMILPWVLHNLRLHGDAFLEGYVEKDLLTTALASREFKLTPLQKYPRDLATEWWPWIPFILHGGWLALRGRLRGERNDRWALPLAWCLAVGLSVVFLRTAYSRYLIPVLPATGVLVGLSVTTLWRGFREAAAARVLAVLAAAGALFVLLWPGSLHSDEAPPVVILREDLGLDRGEGPPLFLGAEMPRAVKAGALFYEDTVVRWLTASALRDLVRARGPRRVMVPAGVREWPEGLEGRVLREGIGEIDLVEFRALPGGNGPR